jgi:acetyltransferase-like isoleucine patch superfamily enzyme
MIAEIPKIKYYFSIFLKKLRGAAISRSSFDFDAKVEAGSKIVDSKFGRHSFCGYDCVIINTCIGSFCSLANNVTIGGAAHPLAFLSTSPVFLSHKDSVKTKFSRHDYLPQIRTEIGHDVWIGDGAYVKAGVKIGHGAAVGMGAVVTKDVPPYAVVGGNPARILKYRFRPEVIEALLHWAWWDLPAAELQAIGPLTHDPEALLRSRGLL